MSKLAVDFFPKVLLVFFLCVTVRIGQNFQNEVWMERCIFAEVAV